MPELPDVAVHEQYIDATSLHRRIRDVTLSNDLVDGVSAQTLRERLRGARFEECRRHGKHLFLRVDDQGWLRLHFGMTGDLQAWDDSGSDGALPDHLALLVDFDDGRHLAYVSTRRLGVISWVDDVDDFIRERALGPDPLEDDLGRDELAGLLDGKRGGIKSALMEQELLAGLGNVYTDEVLFQAGVHPASAVSALADEHVDRLHRELCDVTRTAIRQRAAVADLPERWLLPHRDPDVPCPCCDGRIRKDTIAGRPTYFCSRHQQLID